MKFETLAIHVGQTADAATGAVNVPVYQSSTFKQDAIGVDRGYEYSRTGNPTRQALETALAALEGAAHGLAFASGNAATTAVLNLLAPGDHIVAGSDVYGGTYRLFEKVVRPYGIHTTYVDPADTHAFGSAITDRTKLIWIESPTNPLLKLTDIAGVAKQTRGSDIWIAVDNTFATPYFQQPLALGAHIVLHSTTKYLGGHSDMIGGALVTSNPEAYEKLKFYQNAAGAVPGPWDSYLCLRGIKTLAVRMRQHAASALTIARLLTALPQVERVYYPGLESHPQYALAQTQMSGSSGMISFQLKGGREAVDRFVSKLTLITLAESLGGVESLICHPQSMTHATLGPKELATRNITPNLLRLSVGLENIDDLTHEIRRALE